jgi:high-affinity Fe2+/Pb2+ permease
LCGTVWVTAERPITHYWSVTWHCHNFKWRQMSTSYSDLLWKVFAKRILLWCLQFCHSLRHSHEFLLMYRFSLGRNVSIVITPHTCTMSSSLFTT